MCVHMLGYPTQLEACREHACRSVAAEVAATQPRPHAVAPCESIAHAPTTPFTSTSSPNNPQRDPNIHWPASGCCFVQAGPSLSMPEESPNSQVSLGVEFSSPPRAARHYATQQASCDKANGRCFRCGQAGHFKSDKGGCRMPPSYADAVRSPVFSPLSRISNAVPVPASVNANACQCANLLVALKLQAANIEGQLAALKNMIQQMRTI